MDNGKFVLSLGARDCLKLNWRERSSLLSLVLLAFLLTCFSSMASAKNPDNWVQPFAPFQVIDNVYYVGSAGLSAWLIRTPKGLILLDVGMPANAEMVEKNIQTLGFHLQDVKILLNSHAHFDHAGGIAKLKSDTGATFMASAGDRHALETGVYPGWESRHDFDFPPVKVDRVLRDGDKVSLGDVTLSVLLTPGHTAGATTYLLPMIQNGVHHSVIFFCSASVAANRLAPNPQYPGIVADYRKTFTRLKAIDPDIYLAPHPEFFDLVQKKSEMVSGKPNPFIKPGEFHASIIEFERSFIADLAKQETANKVSSTPGFIAWMRIVH